jgi:citronellol/citronellal dehydrogenase
MEIPPEMVEPPAAMADAAVLLAQQDAHRGGVKSSTAV